jgi:SPOR domain
VAIQSLKHMAFRIWAAAALSVPLSLWLLSLLDNASGLATPILVLTVSFVLFFMASGWLAAQLALRLLPPILHEAGVWERNGDPDRAEKAYRKALALYDSFLMSPGARRQGLPSLVSRMVRLYAAQTDKDAVSDQFMEHYLTTCPTDQEIAENWLQTREYQGGLTPQHQDLAAQIGDTHAANMTIQTTLARLYLLAKRTDFPALQTYRRAMASPLSPSSAMAVDLSAVFIREGRSDEWALPVYLQAAAQQPSWEELRCGIAACLRWILPSERNTDLLARARKILAPIDEEALVRMSSGFVPPTGSYPASDRRGKPTARDRGDIGRESIIERLGNAASRVNQARQHLQAAVLERLRRSTGLRRAMTWSLIAGLGILATVFLINTVGYLTPSPVPEPALQAVAPPPVAPPPPPMPYTLQVAAYLKPEHAERYLASLKKQAIDAYVIKAHGDDKTWYQVRIDHFPDKDTARAYGSRLKEKGIIDDFYVASTQEP